MSLHQQWQNVSTKRVCGAFPESTVLENDDKDDDNNIALSVLFSRDITFDDYASTDDDVKVCYVPTDCDVVDDVITARTVDTTPQQTGSNKNSKPHDVENDADPVLSIADAMTAVQTLQCYLLSITNSNTSQENLFICQGIYASSSCPVFSH